MPETTTTLATTTTKAPTTTTPTTKAPTTTVPAPPSSIESAPVPEEDVHVLARKLYDTAITDKEGKRYKMPARDIKVYMYSNTSEKLRAEVIKDVNRINELGDFRWQLGGIRDGLAAPGELTVRMGNPAVECGPVEEPGYTKSHGCISEWYPWSQFGTMMTSGINMVIDPILKDKEIANATAHELTHAVGNFGHVQGQSVMSPVDSPNDLFDGFQPADELAITWIGKLEGVESLKGKLY